MVREQVIFEQGASHEPSISSPGRGGKTLAHGVSRGDTASKKNQSPGGAIRKSRGGQNILRFPNYQPQRGRF
jgi:hypothetical protein